MMDKKPIISAPTKARRWPQIIATFSAAIGSVALGSAMAWTSPALPHIADCESDCDFHFTDIDGSWIGSLLNLGALPSCLMSGYLMYRIGCKWSMIALSVPFTLGWALILLPLPLDMSYDANKWIFYVGRFLTGFGGAPFTILVSVYSVETAEPSIRGALGSVMSLMITLGVLLDNAVGAFVHWYTLTIIITTLPTIMAACMFLMPESPVYLLSKGREEEARKSLQWFRGSSYDITDELEQMKVNVAHQANVGTVRLTELFTKPEYLKPTVIMLTLMVFRQTTGINAVLFYLTDIFIKADTGFSSELQAMIVALTQVVAIMLVDRSGRKPLMIASALISSVSVYALGAYFHLEEHRCPDAIPECADGTSHDLLRKLSWIPLVSLITFVFGMNLGLGPLPWMMNGEMYSEEAKSTSSALASATNWTTTFLVTKFSANITNAIMDSGTYFLYGSVCFACAVFVLVFVPETKGRSQEELRALFVKPIVGKK